MRFVASRLLIDVQAKRIVSMIFILWFHSLVLPFIHANVQKALG
jgi:hypothetical protein